MMKLVQHGCILGIILALISTSSVFGFIGADVLKPLKYEGEHSYQIIQDAVRPAAEEGNLIALNILRQTMYGLGQDMALEKTPESPIKACDNAVEQAWLEELIRKAENGDPFFTYVLGILYSLGRRVEENPQTAFDLWQKAAEKNLSLAFLMLGKVYQYEHYADMTSQNLPKAAKYYYKAGKMGNPMGWYQLGCMYYNGQGVQKNIEKAVEYWKQSANMGHAKSQHDVGLIYSKGILSVQPGESRFEVAKKWLRKAAKQGHEDATYYLVNRLHDGEFLHEMAEKKESISANLTETDALNYLKKAKQIYDTTRGESDDFLTTIISAESLFPEANVSLEFGKAPLKKYRMNAKGAGIDGIRFKTPAHRVENFVWALAAPQESTISWYIVPIDRFPRTSQLIHTLSKDTTQNFLWPDNYTVMFKYESTGHIVPSKEYILCFIFHENIPVDVYVGLAAYSDEPATETATLDDQFEYSLSHHEQEEAAFGIQRVIPPADLLAKAVKSGNRAFVDYALQNGADVNDTYSLWYAAHKVHPDIVRYLIQLGADPNRTTARGDSPLHGICQIIHYGGNLEQKDLNIAEIIDVLVEAGAEVNLQNVYGETALMYLAGFESPVSTTRLLELGADPFLKDEDGKTALDLAKERDKQENIAILEAAMVKK